MRAVANELAAAVKTPLESWGFRKRSGLVFTREVEPGVLDWVSFNTAARHEPDGRLEVNPIIGIRHQEVARMVAEMTGAKPHAFAGTTLGTSLGYVMPEARYRAWRWSVGDDGVTEDLLFAARSTALEFIEGHRALACVVADDARSLVTDRELDIPVALVLVGQVERAAELVRAHLDALGDRTDAGATLYRRFADTFLHTGMHTL